MKVRDLFAAFLLPAQTNYRSILELIEEATPLSLNFAHLEGIDDVSSIKFDIAIPRLKVIVEYHGIHHFVPGVYGDVRIYQRRDAKKRELCKRNNWTFIEVRSCSLHYCIRVLFKLTIN